MPADPYRWAHTFKRSRRDMMNTVADDEARDAKVVNQMTLEQLERDMNDPETLRNKEIIRRYKAGESYLTMRRELGRLHPEWHTNTNIIAKVVKAEAKRDPTFKLRGTNYNKATGEVKHHKRPQTPQPKEVKPVARTYFSDEDCVDIWIKHKQGKIPAADIANARKIKADAIYRVCSRVDHDPKLRRLVKQRLAQGETKPSAPKAQPVADLLPSKEQVKDDKIAYLEWKVAGYEHGYINRYLREVNKL